MREGWREVPLTEVSEVVMGQSPPGSSYNELGEGLPFIQGSAEFGPRSPTPVKWCTEPKKIAEEGDCLISVRAPVGDLNIADQRIAIGRGLAIVKPKEELQQAFIPYMIEGLVRRLKAVSGGGMFDSVTKASLSSVNCLVPPLTEQHRIADLLTHVDEVISRGRQVEVTLERARRSLLSRLFTVDEVDLTWQESSLGQEVDVIVGGTPSTAEPSFWGGGIPWATPTDITESEATKLSVTARTITRAGLTASSATVVRAGSVLVCTRATIGPAVVADTEMATNQGVTALTPTDPDKISDDWLFYWVQSHRREFQSRGAGNTFKEVSRSKTKSIRFLFPSLVEQERIASILRDIDTTIEAQRTQREELERLRIGLLSVLLSGEHEIPESYDRFLAEVA